MCIKAGYGLEGLPDAIDKSVIAETSTPYFRLDNFAVIINVGMDRMTKLVNNEPLQPLQKQ